MIRLTASMPLASSVALLCWQPLLGLWHTQHEFAAFLTSRIHCDIALDSLQCFLNGPMHTANIFVANLQMSLFYHSTTLFITWFFVQFCVAAGLTAVCFTICMIQCVFSILIYSFNHILIKLPWIEDKQQHCFSIEDKSIISIGYTL